MIIEKLAREVHQLRCEKNDFEHRKNEIQKRIDQIDRRLLEIKWAQHPIGSMVQDDRGDMYQVGGYQSWNLLGYKIKKDGTPSKRLVPIVLKKDRI